MGSFKVGIKLHTDIGPVIKACSFKLLVGNLKTEWADQVEWRMGGRAGARNIPGVLWYLRLIQQHAESFASTQKRAAAYILRIVILILRVVDQSASGLRRL